MTQQPSQEFHRQRSALKGEGGLYEGRAMDQIGNAEERSPLPSDVPLQLCSRIGIAQNLVEIGAHLQRVDFHVA